MSEYKELVSQVLPWHDKIFGMAKQYNQFSLAAMDKYPASHFAKVDGIGSIGIHEQIIAAFFCFLRFKGKDKDAESTRAVATIKNIWWQTKAGIRQSCTDPSQLPLFCRKQVAHNMVLQRLLKTWFVKDLQNAKPKQYLLYEHIETYCMAVIWDHMNDPDANFTARFLFALALRLQCGSGARHKHLSAITWKDAARHEYIVDIGEQVYSVWIVPTKVISELAQPVQFFIADDISHYLFHHWYQAHADKQHTFFLPCIGKKAGFDFARAFSHDNHKEACLDCALTLGLPVADQLKHGYTSNCVRRGIGAQLGSTIKKVLQEHNMNYGRMPNSRIDLDVYCPEDVLQVPNLSCKWLSH